MSTQYTILKHEGFELELDERSSLLDINIWRLGELVTEIEGLTAEQITGIGLELLKVASYVDSDVAGHLDRFTANQADGGYYIDLLREMLK